jgi:hypothetical protein
MAGRPRQQAAKDGRLLKHEERRKCHTAKQHEEFGPVTQEHLKSKAEHRAEMTETLTRKTRPEKGGNE